MPNPRRGKLTMGLREFANTGHLGTLIMSFLYFCVSFMVWVLIGVLGVHIAKDFGLTAAEQGFLVAIPILGGSLVRIPLGILVDRIGPKRVGILTQLIVMLPLLGMWLWGRSFPGVMGFGLLLGVAGGSFAVALPSVSRWYPPHYQGLALGIVGAGNSGTVLAALGAPRLAELVGWHHVFGLALVPVVGSLLLYLVVVQERPSQTVSQPFSQYLQLFGDRDAWWFCLFYSFTFGGFVGLASSLVMFFHDAYGLTTVMAGNVTALCVLAGSFLRPVGGHLADRVGGIRMLTLLFIGASCGLMVVGTVSSLRMVTLFLVGVMSVLGMANGAVFQLVPQRFPQAVGITTGIVGAAGGLGGFLLPIWLGVIKEWTGSYTWGFVGFGIAGLVCLILLRIVQREWRLSWLVESSRVPMALEES